MTEAVLSNHPALVDGKLGTVLEVGTGCGYQTSIIAPLARKVYSVERIKPLQEKARVNLRLLGLHNVHFKHDDGSLGWKEKGPFDAIIGDSDGPVEIRCRESPSRVLTHVGDTLGDVLGPTTGVEGVLRLTLPFDVTCGSFPDSVALVNDVVIIQEQIPKFRRDR